jgi:DNA repair protein RadC
MDEIERLDCFERLRSHLLRSDPDWQKRIEAAQPPDTRNLTRDFFLTSLTALALGLDSETAEGQRRLRRITREILGGLVPFSESQSIGKNSFPDSLAGKTVSSAQLNRLRRAFENLCALESNDVGSGTEPTEPFGALFLNRLDRLDHLPARLRWLRGLLPGFPPLGLFRYLRHIGCFAAVPEKRIQTFLFRLGLLHRTGVTQSLLLEASCQIESLARTLRVSLFELTLWMQAFTGGLEGFPREGALCGLQPHCNDCPLRPYCPHIRHRSVAVSPAGSETVPFSRWRPGERPRERLMRLGAAALDETELLAIVLRTGAGKVNVLELARLLLERFETLRGIEDASLEELQTLHGIGRFKAVELKAALELGRRREQRLLEPGQPFRSSADVFAAYRSRFSLLKQEEFLILMLDKRNRVIRDELISRGGLDASIVHPREVFKAALRASAAAVIFIHNHPSGDPTPSQDDRLITQRLRDAGQLLQIEMLDHLIIGASAYYSFSDGAVFQADGR